MDRPVLNPALKAEVTTGPGGLGGLREGGIRGRVRVRLLVGADGIPASADVVHSSGDPALDAAAQTWLLQWRFTPARRDGEPIAAYLLLWVTFIE